MPKRRAASRWLSPSTWQAWRTRAYSSTAFILTLPAVRTGRKIRRRLFTPPPRPDTPAASVRDFLSAAYKRVIHVHQQNAIDQVRGDFARMPGLGVRYHHLPPSRLFLPARPRNQTAKAGLFQEQEGRLVFREVWVEEVVRFKRPVDLCTA